MARPELQQLRILIADDHDIVREGLRALLRPRSCWLVCAEAVTGREAVSMALHHKPDMAILDFSMPELNGLEAAFQIRKALPETEVLIITMHYSEYLLRDVLKAGARGLLLKTNVRRHLIPAVCALAEHTTYFDDSVSARFLDTLLNAERATPGSAKMLDRLTPREREILQLVAEGKASKEIAYLLGITTKTVEAHRANLMNKLDLHSVSELVRYAIRNKIVTP